MYSDWMRRVQAESDGIRAKSNTCQPAAVEVYQSLLGVLISISGRAQIAKVSANGKSEACLRNQELHIAVFLRTLKLADEAVFGGHYAQAAALQKQQVDCLSLIESDRKHTLKRGKTPNAQNALGTKVASHLKKLNDVAHLSGN